MRYGIDDIGHISSQLVINRGSFGSQMSLSPHHMGRSEITCIPPMCFEKPSRSPNPRTESHPPASAWRPAWWQVSVGTVQQMPGPGDPSGTAHTGHYICKWWGGARDPQHCHPCASSQLPFHLWWWTAEHWWLAGGNQAAKMIVYCGWNRKFFDNEEMLPFWCDIGSRSYLTRKKLTKVLRDSQLHNSELEITL